MSRGPTNYTDPKSIIAWNTRAAPVVTDKMVDAALLSTLGRAYNSKQTMRAALTAALAQMEGKE
jgi:hypothetical protein